MSGCGRRKHPAEDLACQKRLALGSKLAAENATNLARALVRALPIANIQERALRIFRGEQTGTDGMNEVGRESQDRGNTVEMDEEAGMTGAENKMVETANRGMQHRRLARLVQTETLMVVVPVSPIGAGTKLRAVRAVLEDGAKENAHPGVGTRLRDRLENHRKGAGWISTLKSGKKSKSSWIETGIVTMMKGQW